MRNLTKGYRTAPRVVKNWCTEDKLLLITAVGVILLLLKLFGVNIPIGYLLIFGIILWPVTFMVVALLGIIMFMLLGLVHIWFTDEWKGRL